MRLSSEQSIVSNEERHWTTGNVCPSCSCFCISFRLSKWNRCTGRRAIFQDRFLIGVDKDWVGSVTWARSFCAYIYYILRVLSPPSPSRAWPLIEVRFYTCSYARTEKQTSRAEQLAVVGNNLSMADATDTNNSSVDRSSWIWIFWQMEKHLRQYLAKKHMLAGKTAEYHCKPRIHWELLSYGKWWISESRTEECGKAKPRGTLRRRVMFGMFPAAWLFVVFDKTESR